MTCKEKREHGQQAGKLQPGEVQLARKLTRETESRRQTSCQETFHWEQRARMEWPCFRSQLDPYVTRTMRDSVCTEGKPQSPPQHLSSMAAAMFDSWMEPVTSPGSRPIRSQGREGTPGLGKETQWYLAHWSFHNVFITPVYQNKNGDVMNRLVNHIFYYKKWAVRLFKRLYYLHCCMLYDET